MMLALVSCTTIYTGTVTLTDVMKSASQSYAKAFNDGLVPPDVAAKVAVAHANYQKAAGVAEASFTAFKAGQNVDTKAALEGARVAASQFIDLLTNFIPPKKTTELQRQLQKVNSP